MANTALEALHVVCSQCAAINRVPMARLAESPNCGKCHRPLFAGHAADVDAANFDKQIARNDIPVLVDFWAPWCNPCQMMAPHFAQAAQLLEPQVRLIKVNTEAQPSIAARFNIRSIPTLKLFWRGREIASHAGAMGAQDIVRWVRSQQG